MKHSLKLLCLLLPLLSACSATKYVGENEYLLDKVIVETDNKDVKASSLKAYVRQEPNHKAFGLVRFPLHLYSLSGRDSTKRINRWLRRTGTPPVIYSESLTERSRQEIEKALSNQGYMGASVSVDTIIKKKKITVKYKAVTGEPYYIDGISYNIPNDTIRRIVLQDTSALLLKNGALFDRNVLEEERQRISTLLRNRGYYAFNKEYITYTADTTRSHRVNLELNLMPMPVESNGQLVYEKHKTYRINQVYFITNYDPMNTSTEQTEVLDTVDYKGYKILYGEKRFIKKSTLVNNCYIEPGQLFSNRMVDNTYSAFSRLRVLKYVNIRFVPIEVGEEEMLNCYILLTEGKSQTISIDVEGTNSAGDFGFAVGLTHQHRNIFKGSETWSTKFRMAYESLSGNFGSIINDNYTELSAETGITYPQFLFPFLSSSFKKRLRATTEFSINANLQQRPEYTRVIAGAGWKYKWNTRRNRFRHTLDLVDVSYVYLPKSISGFIDSISPENPLLRYSYEDHFIMRSSYIFYRTNLNTASNKLYNIYTLRAAGEIAGNLLYGLSKLTGQKRGADQEYSFLGIRYSQYAKADLDYSYTFRFTEKNSLALHVGTGIAIPYGNSEMLPFEKRYFSGGANSVRGWSVRTLGPGTYRGENTVTDFMNQCGDIRLDLNAEYRSKIIWKLELAAFIDAGNIWTIRSYPQQPGGVFKLRSFYKELAMAYGLGARLDFNYFILRFDLGIKAFDPSLTGSKRWVIANQDLRQDATLHFAVGYPF